MTAVASSCGGCCGLELFFFGGGESLIPPLFSKGGAWTRGRNSPNHNFALSHFVTLLSEISHKEINIYFSFFFWQISCPPKRAVRRGGRGECLLACPQSPPRPIQLRASPVPTPKNSGQNSHFPPEQNCISRDLIAQIFLFFPELF